MSTIEINWSPSPRQLRQFALLSLLAMPLVAWLLSGRPGPATWAARHTLLVGGLATVGAILAGLGWFRPGAVKPVYIAASVVAFPLGLVLGEIIMAVVFLAVFLPVGLLFRCAGRDALDRRLDPGTDTYWQDKRQPADVQSYFRQS